MRSITASARLSVDHGPSLVRAAVDGVGIVQAPDVMVRRLVDAGALEVILEKWAVPGPPIHALYLPGRDVVPGVRALINALVDCFAEG